MMIGRNFIHIFLPVWLCLAAACGKEQVQIVEPLGTPEMRITPVPKLTPTPKPTPVIPDIVPEVPGRNIIPGLAKDWVHWPAQGADVTFALDENTSTTILRLLPAGENNAAVNVHGIFTETPILAGKTYLVGCRIRSTEASSGIEAVFLDVKGKLIERQMESGGPAAHTGEWTIIKKRIMAPKNAAVLRLIVPRVTDLKTVVEVKEPFVKPQ